MEAAMCPCSAHNRLCVLAGLSISAIDRAVKKIVSHFSHSVVATVALKEARSTEH